jgi:predicted secreted protein
MIILSLLLGLAFSQQIYNVDLSTANNSVVLNQLHPNDSVVISAIQNPSTGYTWQISPTTNTAVYTI